jgi:hypothetical protein
MRTTIIAVIAAVAALTISCNGGGGGGHIFPPGTLPHSAAIQSINISPSSVTTGTAVELTATYTDSSYFADKTKVWDTAGGSLTETAPDFDLVLRGTAGIKSASATLSTTSSRVFWFTPTSPGSYTIKLTIGKATFSRSVAVTSAPIYLEVTPGANNTTTVRIMARDVTDLYQGAFRVIFNPNRFQATEARAGSFLGGANDILFLGLTNQAGFVPIGITRKGNVAGISGDGVIAEVVFSDRTASHAPSSIAIAGFELGTYLMLDSKGATIWGD